MYFVICNKRNDMALDKDNFTQTYKTVIYNV